MNRFVLMSESVNTSPWITERTLQVQTHDQDGGEEARHTATIIPFLQSKEIITFQWTRQSSVSWTYWLERKVRAQQGRCYQGIKAAKTGRRDYQTFRAEQALSWDGAKGCQGL